MFFNFDKSMVWFIVSYKEFKKLQLISNVVQSVASFAVRNWNNNHFQKLNILLIISINSCANVSWNLKYIINIMLWNNQRVDLDKTLYTFIRSLLNMCHIKHRRYKGNILIFHTLYRIPSMNVIIIFFVAIAVTAAMFRHLLLIIQCNISSQRHCQK